MALAGTAVVRLSDYRRHRGAAGGPADGKLASSGESLLRQWLAWHGVVLGRFFCSVHFPGRGFIGGVFAFTAFKVEGNAAQEARKTAREEARYTVKRQVESILIETARKYLEEEAYDGSGDGKNRDTRGRKAALDAADDYLENNGDKIAREVAKEYVDNNGSAITREVTDAYVNNNGERITGERADIYIRENVESDGQKQPRGEKVARQVVDGYVKDVVDNYASEDPENKGETRLEKMTRETVEKISADEVARLVDKYLASLRLVDLLRIGFRRGGGTTRASADAGLAHMGDGANFWALIKRLEKRGRVQFERTDVYKTLY